MLGHESQALGKARIPAPCFPLDRHASVKKCFWDKLNEASYLCSGCPEKVPKPPAAQSRQFLRLPSLEILAGRLSWGGIEEGLWSVFHFFFLLFSHQLPS